MSRGLSARDIVSLRDAGVGIVDLEEVPADEIPQNHTALGELITGPPTDSGLDEEKTEITASPNSTFDRRGMVQGAAGSLGVSIEEFDSLGRTIEMNMKNHPWTLTAPSDRSAATATLARRGQGVTSANENWKKSKNTDERTNNKFLDNQAGSRIPRSERAVAKTLEISFENEGLYPSPDERARYESMIDERPKAQRKNQEHGRRPIFSSYDQRHTPPSGSSSESEAISEMAPAVGIPLSTHPTAGGDVNPRVETSENTAERTTTINVHHTVPHNISDDRYNEVNGSTESSPPNTITVLSEGIITEPTAVPVFDGILSDEPQIEAVVEAVAECDDKWSFYFRGRRYHGRLICVFILLGVVAIAVAVAVITTTFRDSPPIESISEELTAAPSETSNAHPTSKQPTKFPSIPPTYVPTEQPSSMQPTSSPSHAPTLLPFVLVKEGTCENNGYFVIPDARLCIEAGAALALPGKIYHVGTDVLGGCSFSENWVGLFFLRPGESQSELFDCTSTLMCLCSVKHIPPPVLNIPLPSDSTYVAIDSGTCESEGYSIIMKESACREALDIINFDIVTGGSVAAPQFVDGCSAGRFGFSPMVINAPGTGCSPDDDPDCHCGGQSLFCMCSKKDS